MEGKGRSRRRRGGREARRRISALLSVALTTAMTLNAPLGALGFGVMEAFASSSDARPATGSDAGSGTSAPDGGHAGPEDLGEGSMTAKNAEYVKGQAQDVDIYVIAEDTDVAPGNTSTMRLYLKNNTGSPITDGTLSFTGTRIKKEDGTFTDISGSGVSAEDTTVDDWGDAADMDEAQLDELEALEAEEYAREFGKDGDGQGLNKLTGLHLEPGQLHEIEFEFYTDDSVSAGKAYVDFKFQGEGADGKVRSSEKFYYSIGLPSVEIELLDGQALETGVEHELSIWMAAPSWGDYEIEEVQIPVKGTTAAETEAEIKESTAPTEQGAAIETQGTEAQTGEAGTEPETEATEAEREPETEATGAQAGATEAQTEEETQVAVTIIEDEPVPIQGEDSGEELTAGIILNERETVQAPLKRTADVSILETEASPEGSTEEPAGEAAEETVTEAAPEEDGEQDTAAPAEDEPAATTEPAADPEVQESTSPTETTEAAADPTDPAIESIPDTAPAVEGTAPTESTVDEDAIKASEEAAAKEAEQAAQQVQALAIKESKVSYTVEVFGTEFKRFRPKKTTEIEDIGWISCLYELAEDARPGIYYGKVTAKGKWNRRSFTTSQGFLFEITGEGTITLKGELDGTEVKVSGPASSFPEADKLELVVEALSQEEEEAVQEAIEKKDAPYATFSLSLLADGETADTTGPVTVKVGNRTIKESTAQLTAASEAKAVVAAAAQEAAAQPQAQAGTEDTYTADDPADIATDITTDTTDSTTDAVTDDAEGEKAPVDTRKGPGADGKGFSGAALTADGTLKAAAEAKAEKETEEPVIAGSQEAGLALMKIDTLAVEAEEVKADVTESGDLQTTTNEVMAIYAVTGLDEAHPVFIDSVTLEDGVTVTVAAAEGVLPEGTYLSVEEVTAQVADIVKKDLETKGKTGVSEVLAYDINLMVDGVKLENEYWNDDNKVKVTFSGPKIEEISQNADTVEIAPLDAPTDTIKGAKEGVAEVVKLEEITADNTQVLTDEIQTVQEAGDEAVSEFNIDAEHFTVYVVIGGVFNVQVPGVKANTYYSTNNYNYSITIGTNRYNQDGDLDIYLSKIPTEGSEIAIDDISLGAVDYDGEKGTKAIAVYYGTKRSSYYTSYVDDPKTITRFQYTNNGLVAKYVEDGEEKTIAYTSANQGNFYWITEKNGTTYEMYFYALMPPDPDLTMEQVDEAIKKGEFGLNDAWYAMGIGKIETDRPATQHTRYQNGKMQDGIVLMDPEDNEKYAEHKIILPDELLNKVVYMKPDAAKGRPTARMYYLESYYESLTEAQKNSLKQDKIFAGTFTVQWIRTTVSGGANAGTGNNDWKAGIVGTGWRERIEQFTTKSDDKTNNTNIYHQDGIIVVKDRQYPRVSFYIQEPGTEPFDLKASWCVPYETLETESAMQNDTQGNKHVFPDTKRDGHVFIGWYYDEACTQPVDFTNSTVKITEDKNYYGKFIEATQKIDLVKKFEELDGRWPVDKLGLEKVSFTLEKVTKEQSGFTYGLPQKLSGVGDVNKRETTFSFTVSANDILNDDALYRLEETDTAPAYQKLETQVYVQIQLIGGKVSAVFKIMGADGQLNDYTGTDVRWEPGDGKLNGYIEVTNHPVEGSTILPDTGGPGLLQFNRFGWLLLLIALMMAGTEVRYFGAQKSKVEAEATEDRWPGSQGPDWM